tara:strand:- start:2016 stop:3233 length:1218 start_codon:yes stop_codon:yes gene_type:complete
MSKRDKYTVYNTQIDKFIQVEKLRDEDVDEIFQLLKQRVKEPGFNINKYICFIVGHCIKDCLKIYEKHEGDLADSLFDNVIDVYPCFAVDNAMRVLNIGEDVKPVTTKDYTLKQIEAINKRMKKRLIGQDKAIDEVTKAVKLVNSGLEDNLSLFFIGPTGVGKTEMARILADEYLGGQKKLLKINCGEYSNSHEYAKLIGSPPGYIGHNEKGILTERAEESNEWVILFDEIEKAHPKFYNLLLNLLDEGNVTDSRGTVLDFSKSIILFTSNVGIKDNVGRKTVGFGGHETSYDEAKDDVVQEFEKKFSPEFRNRLDGVVHFNQLTKADASKIAKIQLSKLPVYSSPKLVEYIVRESFSPMYGARNINRFIKNNITTKIADKILSGQRDVKFRAVFDKNSFLDVSA